MRDRLIEALEAFSGVYSGWILWNLFLAFIPLVLSFWLFRRKTSQRSWLWWTLFATFIVFLPNAPYMLTDIIHLLRGTRVGYDLWIIVLVFLPLHTIAILLGFEAYVISLLNQGYYLKRYGAGRRIIWTELGCHALCAIGIYLGRFQRFNSWDLVTDRVSDVLVTTVNDLTSQMPVLIVFISFVILTVLYWIMKQITLGLYLRFYYARAGLDIPE